MKALILAAGRGTRVRPLTDTLPKPMIPIINKPVMEFLVEHLARYNIRHIMVNTSYLSTQIEGYFREGSRFGVEIAYSFEGHLSNGLLHDKPLGSAGAIQKIQQHAGFFDETFVVICGDAIIDLDFDEMLATHRSSGALATIALREVAAEEVSNYGVVVQNAQGRIIEFQEKPSQSEAKSRLVNTGIYIFEPEILDYIPKNQIFDIGSQLFPILAKRGLLQGHTSKQDWQWLDIGRIHDFHQVTLMAIQGKIPRYHTPGREIRPGLFVGLNVNINLNRCYIEGPVYIGGGSQIQDGTSLIGPLVIGSNCVLEGGVHLKESVVMEYTRVKVGLYGHRKIFCGQSCIDAEGTILDQRFSDTEWLFADSRCPDPALTEDQYVLWQYMHQLI